MDRLQDLISTAGRVAVFTGAGVSTLCGIPDFRSPGGIYSRVDPDRIFAIDEFRRDPSYFYTEAREFIYGMGDKEPGPVHRVCAELERRGLCTGIITQNIDMLHQKAGARRVIELHGSPASHTCPGCGSRTGFAEIAAVVRQREVPRCPVCGGVPKPDITFFGEMLPPGALEGALALAAASDLLLVLGSSLLVHPAAGVPVATLQAGGRIAIVNRESTPLDRHAVFRGDDLAGEFAALGRWLGLEEDP